MDRVQGVVVFNYPTDPEVDFFLWLHTLCSKYGALPAEGGVFDQDPYLLYGLTSVIRAVSQREEREHEKAKRDSKRKSSGARRRR